MSTAPTTGGKTNGASAPAVKHPDWLLKKALADAGIDAATAATLTQKELMDAVNAAKAPAPATVEEKKSAPAPQKEVEVRVVTTEKAIPPPPVSISISMPPQVPQFWLVAALSGTWTWLQAAVIGAALWAVLSPFVQRLAATL